MLWNSISHSTARLYSFHPMYWPRGSGIGCFRHSKCIKSKKSKFISLSVSSFVVRSHIWVSQYKERSFKYFMHFVSSFLTQYWLSSVLVLKWNELYIRKRQALPAIYGITADKPVACQFCEEQVKDSSLSHETSEVYTYSIPQYLHSKILDTNEEESRNSNWLDTSNTT